MARVRGAHPIDYYPHQVLAASVLSDDPAKNLQLGLGVELAVLPPYLYALWSIKSRAEGASQAAVQAATAIRGVVYEEMLHAGLVCNLLNAIGAPPNILGHLMSYPGPLPGHTTDPKYAYDVGLLGLSQDAAATFMRIELPEWDEASASPDWITIADLYAGVKRQLEQGQNSFAGGRQFPLGDNPGPSQLTQIDSLQSAVEAIDIVIDQGEGHKPTVNPNDPNDVSYESDDDHEVAHYYQFKTIASYFDSGAIELERDVHPVIANPDAGKYTPAQQRANDRFNKAYSALLDRLQNAVSSNAPRAFGPPTEIMAQLEQLAAVLRNAGTVPGTDRVAGPTFQYLYKSSERD